MRGVLLAHFFSSKSFQEPRYWSSWNTPATGAWIFRINALLVRKTALFF